MSLTQGQLGRLGRYCRRHQFRILGALALLMGVGFAALVAYLGSSHNPPSGSQSGFLVVISGLFQLAAAYLFSRGSPTSEALRIQLQGHKRLADDLVTARLLAEAAIDDGSAPASKKVVGELSWRLSQAARDHEDLAANWIMLYSKIAITGENGTEDERRGPHSG